jgi:pimeloyl-ACP methyl ester carboxylesterase
LFALLHRPPGDAHGTAVLLCPPFGWDEICSYRARHDWAARLAQAGYPTLRLDLPSTGDSGGDPYDSDRLGAWCEAVTTASHQLRALDGCDALAAIGIGLGGMLLWRAICEQAPIDEVVLWGVHRRGRSLLRELRAFARLQETTGGQDLKDAGEAGHLAVGGFVMTQETCAALELMDLSSLRPPEPLCRVLLLDRDGMSTDPLLRSHLEQNAAEFAAQPGPGFGAMTAKPHLARAPLAVFEAVEQWLGATEVERATPPVATTSVTTYASGQDAQACAQSAEADIGHGVRESAITVPQPFGNLFAVLAQPARHTEPGLCAVLLNAGAIRRVGPNRMWVQAARRWAASGIPTVRLDLEGIGDADGDGERLNDLAELYETGLISQVRDALDVLQTRGLGERFVLTGLCSGACWSFHCALEDPRVVSALLLNPRALFWDPTLETERDLRRGVMRTSAWRKVLRGDVPRGRLVEAAAKAPRAPLQLARRSFARQRARNADSDRLTLAFDTLRDAGKPLLFLFSGDEPLHEELVRDGYVADASRWPNIRFEALPGADHTLRPLTAQREAHRKLDAALQRLTQSPMHA